jgi:hypothetical protein
MTELNEAEARIAIGDVLTDLLTEIAIDDEDLPEDEIDEIENQMQELAMVILDLLKVEVLNVKGDELTCKVVLPPLESQ